MFSEQKCKNTFTLVLDDVEIPENFQVCLFSTK